jgi:hypothetical protein
MKFNFNNTKYILIIVFFLLGLYYYVNFVNIYESFDNDNNSCHDLLIEKDGEILLINTKADKNSTNSTIKFNNLEEYVDYVEKQNQENNNCPILFLQYTTDTQNNESLQIKPSILENTGGLASQQSNTILDATTTNNKKYNGGMYQAMDTHNQDIGLDTPLDKLFVENNKEKSANPMDPNWGGKEYTKKAIDSGKYAGRYVYKHPPMQKN